MTRNKFILGFVLLLPFLLSNYYTYKYKTAGAHPGSTGAPGELTCAKSGCHSGATPGSGVGTNTLTFPSLDSTYVPGQTYSMNVAIFKTNITKFGFELTALKDSNNRGIGTFSITDAVRTQTISATVSGQPRISVTHKTAGTPAITTGSTNWNFNWTAPATNQGNITFYYATNCTNNNGLATGDNIFLSTFTIKPKITSVNEIIAKKSVKIFYNQERGTIQLTYILNSETNTTINICDASGRIVYNEEPVDQAPGKIVKEINIDSYNLSKGIYFINVVTSKQTVTEKLLL